MLGALKLKKAGLESYVLPLKKNRERGCVKFFTQPLFELFDKDW